VTLTKNCSAAPSEEFFVGGLFLSSSLLLFSKTGMKFKIPTFLLLNHQNRERGSTFKRQRRRSHTANFPSGNFYAAPAQLQYYENFWQLFSLKNSKF
jgi:hypothetical protein